MSTSLTSHRRFRLSVLVSCLLLALILAWPFTRASRAAPLAAAAAERADPPSKPLQGDFADPFVFRDGRTYYAFATNAAGKNIQVASSRDLANWAPLPDALPRLPSWASRDRGLTWAPSVLARAGRYVLYYTTRDAASGYQCISRAVATAASGPYVDESAAPFVCQVKGPGALCGSIDPSPFVDEDGSAYLLWKSDENSASCGKPPRLWIQSLSEDGLNLAGTPAALLTKDEGWEEPIVEGPSMVRRGRDYFLFYSANWYESASYAIGYATCATPRGPCRKVTVDAPFVKSSGQSLGPGGQEFFADASGKTFMVYHAWTAPTTSYAGGGARSLHVVQLLFHDGKPSLAEAIAAP